MSGRALRVLCYLGKPSLLDFPVRLIICLLTVMCLFSSSATVQAEEEPSRFCVGFLYCKETKGDTTTTEALIYLYSTEERGTFSRLTVIPFYSREMDPAQNYLRRSILWPLGISERKGDAYYFQILPFYWQAEEETSRYQIVVPLYFDYSSEDKRYNHLIPFYGHHQEKLRHRYFILGPVAIATYDKEADLKEWDILMPMFHYGGDRNGYETRLFPMYWSGGSYNEGSWYRHLAPLYWSGANQLEGTEYRHLLPLYGRSVTSRSDLMYLFPLYGSVTDFPEKTSRTSAVGLPPIPQSQLPSLALYEHASSPASVSDRLFPLYRYAHDEAADLADLNIIGLFQLDKSPTLTAHRLFPLYMYESDRQADETGWSGLGYGRFSLVGFGSDPRQRWHHFIPLYHTSEDLTAGTLTTDAVGLGPLSFFRYSRTPDGWSHRFFPLYRYEHPSADEWHWSALFAAPLALYRHDEKGTAVHDRFIPLYAWDRNGDWREFSMLGISWFSMFYRESGPTRVTNRLFPLYRYHHDLAADEVKMDTLLLHRHHTTPARGDDRFLFLWDATWQRDEPMWELYLIGFKPVTLFHHEAAQAGTADRLFPIFGYRSSSEGERRLSLIGFPPRETGFAWSLYEQRSAPNGFHTRLFPLYRFERDDAAKEVNWSALLLYQHRQSKSHLVDKLPPLHEFERDDEKGTTELNLIGLKPLTLFKQGFGTDSANSMLFPLYDYDRAGDSNRLSAIGLPKVGSLPTLSLFEREGTPSLTTHRFFPLYAYAQDRVAHTRSWEGLLLWWHREKESHLRDFFLPLTDLERDDGDDSYRLSLLGLPKMGSFPPLTLFSYEREQSQLTHRMFPIYRYNRNDEAKTLNWDALLWWHRETEYWSQNVFYPFADLEYDRQKDQRDVGLFGMRPLTFFQYRSSPTEYWHYAALFYAYLTDVDQQRLSILGLPHYRQFPALSLFAMERTPSSLTHRFFPLYWYAWDDPSETLDWEALLLWWHHERKGYLRNLFLPLSDVERDNANESRRVSLIGLPKLGTLPPLTLFNWEQTATTTAHRMVPLYSYAKD
ncbi:MAG TPA: hypothetical protein VFQ34_10155, partial [Nitrospiraceae bacterium]|nr:hypothetical protein [Nitrospiraceae bacterium]